MNKTAPGLSGTQLQTLKDVFSHSSNVDSVVLYGSRAKGTHNRRSDIDLAVKGDLNRHQLASLKLDLEDTDLPYSFDVLDYSELNNPQLKAHIDRVGIVIYQR